MSRYDALGYKLVVTRLKEDLNWYVVLYGENIIMICDVGMFGLIIETLVVRVTCCKYVLDYFKG